MKKSLLLSLSIVTFCVFIYALTIRSEKQINKVERKSYKIVENEEEETPEARARFVEERFLYEYYRQVNPISGDIPKAQKELELDRSIKAKLKINSNSRTIETSYINRGQCL